MEFPTTIATISSALTILDYLVKFANYLSPGTKRALSQAEATLTNMDKDTPPEQIDSVIQNQLKTLVPLSRVNEATMDVYNSMDVLSQMFRVLQQAKNSDVLPLYGDAYNALFLAIHQKLNNWGCFNAWGQKFSSNNSPVPNKAIRNIILPLENTTKSLKHCEFAKRLRIQSPSRKLFIGTTHPLATSLGDNYFYNLGLHETIGNYRRLLLIGDRPHDSYKDLIILRFSRFGVDGFDYILHATKDKDKFFHLKIGLEDFTMMVAGILNDYIYFARKVRAEIKTSENFVNKLKNIFDEH